MSVSLFKGISSPIQTINASIVSPTIITRHKYRNVLLNRKVGSTSSRHTPTLRQLLTHLEPKPLETPLPKKKKYRKYNRILGRGNYLSVNDLVAFDHFKRETLDPIIESTSLGENADLSEVSKTNEELEREWRIQTFGPVDEVKEAKRAAKLKARAERRKKRESKKALKAETEQDKAEEEGEEEEEEQM